MTFEEWEEEYVDSDLTSNDGNDIINASHKNKFKEIINNQAGLPDIFKNEVETAFSSGTPIAQQAYLKYFTPDDIGDIAYNKRARFISRENKIFINVNDLLNDTKKSGALERDAFAHMYECQFDRERYALMQQYFPTALAEFEKMLGGIV